MLIIINLINMTINNLILSYPLYVIPDYRISRKKFFLIYATWGILFGNIKYFCPQDSIWELIMTIANNVTLLLILAFTLKGKFYKFVIAFGLFAFASFSSQSLSALIGVVTDTDVYDINLTYIALIHTFWGILLYAIIFGIKRYLDKKAIPLNVNYKGMISIYLLAFYTLVSQMYNNRAVNDITQYTNAPANNFWYVFFIVGLVCAIIISRKNTINEHNKVSELEKIKLEQIIAQNEYIAKLRHDYINEINVVKLMAQREPQKAIEILDEMEAQYRDASSSM